MGSVGRPLKYKTVEDFLSVESGWLTEREFCDFIELNVERFCSDVDQSDYLSHRREWPLVESRPFGGNKPRIDFMIETSKGRIGIECKRPVQAFAELSRSISQLLAYGAIADNNHVPLERLYLLTTQYEPIVGQLIAKYELPIRVVVFSRGMRAEAQW